MCMWIWDTILKYWHFCHTHTHLLCLTAYLFIIKKRWECYSLFCPFKRQDCPLPPSTKASRSCFQSALSLLTFFLFGKNGCYVAPLLSPILVLSPSLSFLPFPSIAYPSPTCHSVSWDWLPTDLPRSFTQRPCVVWTSHPLWPSGTCAILFKPLQATPHTHTHTQNLLCSMVLWLEGD